MELTTCTNRDVLVELSQRMVDARIAPIEASMFLNAEIIRIGLRRFNGRVTTTAAWFGVHRNRLSRWIEFYKIDMVEFRPVGRKGRKKPVQSVPPWREQEVSA